ncbi:MAG: ice-binding family protein [Ferruginibacter sp.]
MKIQFIPSFVIAIALLSLPKLNFGQLLNLGTIENFTCFTGDGAITNAGTSAFSADIGSNLGIISGFELPTTLNGTIYNAQAITQQAKLDLLNIYIHLNDLAITDPAHAAAFGGGETITTGVYSIPGAGSVGGTLTLDGQGNSNAIFIIKFEGAMTVGAGTTVILLNEARSCNVFWIAEGAISMGASVIMKGTLIAHPGAVSMGPGGDLEGRMISTSGAITFGPGVAGKPGCLSSVPITCITTCINTTLGTAANFALFTSAGAVANTGISGIIGDIGSDFGAVSGWEASVVIGSTHNADGTTAQAKIDLQAAYDQLFNTAATNTTHTPAFGSGETLTPGVYSVAAAGSLAGDITLNGGGNINAVFIFKFGAAFSVGARSKIILTNGARRCNIFWIADGAISIAAFSIMKGNFIANNGAIDMGANGFLEGRLFSTTGAVGFNTGTAYISYSLCTAVILPVGLISFTGTCDKQKVVLKWSTASEINSKIFTVERSEDGINWHPVGTVAGAGNSTGTHLYTLTDNIPAPNPLAWYRLKQTDLNENHTYGNVIIIKKCVNGNSENVTLYPNPSYGKFDLLVTGDVSAIQSTEIFNSMGEKVYSAIGAQTKFDLSKKTAGIYFVYVHLQSQTFIRKIIKK